jgi:hypothetical protein
MVFPVTPLFRFRVILCLFSVFVLFGAAGFAQSAAERRVVDLANQSRAEAGLPPLQWDPALARAAYAHSTRMASEGPISHRYGGEADLAERAAAAGAHFSLIEENIAVGQSPAQVHDGWMHSPGHHDNLMNSRIDRIGVSLVETRGVLYATADYAQSVQELTPTQVESRVGAIVAGRGIALLASGPGVAGARRYCALEEGQSGAGLGLKALFLMRWQSADIAKLPPELQQALASGRYTQAAVGACEAKPSPGSSIAVFTAYRVAVLLY